MNWYLRYSIAFINRSFNFSLTLFLTEVSDNELFPVNIENEYTNKKKSYSYYLLYNES